MPQVNNAIISSHLDYVELHHHACCNTRRSTAVLGIALRDTVEEPYLTQHARLESNATLIHFVRSLSVNFPLSLTMYFVLLMNFLSPSLFSPLPL
ncbi:hypothetical protein BDV27DRAFT_135157 [Aspergillus caelatus]|uniref:Uncharacterized protein n=2 Tax=Aspergillus subgen. Circumdati TaxID=2720871 RepID=A0A5N6ZQY1_9EURO|nr:uncharacterized protein BDV27DRAFT_135157 [Aspergillus caelatus]KAE8360052.1 hypothetical protein BDV27DRAFT_135157 [Aspergillus caelatus]KAE8410598.1 hypothetical protein BDV36DRAFT_277283 [Aspergillus pseudocaelatus]